MTSGSIKVALVVIMVFSAVVSKGGEPSNSTDDCVVFPRKTTVNIVAIPSCSTEERIIQKVSEYCSNVTGIRTAVIDDMNTLAVNVSVVVVCNAFVQWPFDENVTFAGEGGYAIRTGEIKSRKVVALIANNEKGLKRALQRFVILSRQTTDALVIPQLNIQTSPWIQQREWALCPWEPSRVRGVFRNNHVDPRLNIYSYSSARLEKYIEMLDWFGYSGCQILETCATYAAFGQIDAAQEWIGQAMDIVKAQGQDVSLWVWAAQFQGYDWNDPESYYHVEPGQRVFSNPQVRAIFERYYDGYVKHAGKIDRLFGHFFDPGDLKSRDDVFDFMRMLEAKAKAKNPNIQMGIGTWAAGEGFFQALVDQQFNDYLLLTVAIPIYYQGNARQIQHQKAKDLNLELGYWGWYQTEMETDQMPSLFVNAKLLKDFYNRLRNEAFSIHPVHYYSEMEAHHLNNIYSMYAAAQLLWDPDRDPDDILLELTQAIWGPQNGAVVLNALELIQDVRTGPTWETYWWTSPAYRLGTDDPNADLRRTKKSIAELKAMKPDHNYVPKIPLPFAPETFVELMMPHLQQIQQYSEFRVKIKNLKKAADSGAEKEQLEKMLQDAWRPIPEYDTWVGVFGTPELRMQRQIVLNLEKQYGIDVTDPAHLVYMEADRLLQQFQNIQSSGRHRIELEPLQAAGQFFWPQEVAISRFQKLVDQKLLLQSETGKYYLTDWKNWALK